LLDEATENALAKAVAHGKFGFLILFALIRVIRGQARDRGGNIPGFRLGVVNISNL